MFLFGGQVNAQKEEYKKAMRYHYEPYEKQVEMVLTNLTDNQREALHKLSKENKEYMKKYRKDREQLEKIIKSLLEMKGDVSEALFPLIDMKWRLEAEKEKNFYKMKLEIDSILTAEQREKMKEYEKKMKEEVQKHRDEIKQKVKEKKKTREEHLEEHANSLR
jgi:Spy/CpxP family protein refolding chaperone